MKCCFYHSCQWRRPAGSFVYLFDGSPNNIQFFRSSIKSINIVKVYLMHIWKQEVVSYKHWYVLSKTIFSRNHELVTYKSTLGLQTNIRSVKIRCDEWLRIHVYISKPNLYLCTRRALTRKYVDQFIVVICTSHSETYCFLAT